MEKRKRNIIIVTVLSAVALVGIACCGIPLAWLQWRHEWDRSVDQEGFLAVARADDPRIAKVYELFPEAEARFNEGNRSGRRGAFAPIAQTYTLTAKIPGEYELKLYRGIAPRYTGPNGITVVESAYGVVSPKGQLADLTPEEFDAILAAKGDVGVLMKEIWARPPLPSKNLGREK